MDNCDWEKIVGKGNPDSDQYSEQIQRLRNQEICTKHIEKAVQQSLENVLEEEVGSFVIFGEPQSGKTEMMIVLNAKLLDDMGEKYPILVNLVNDNVALLQQNLRRFQNSGLNPSPILFSDLPENSKDLQGKEWIIFCKKNTNDLQKLTESLRNVQRLIIIDDEADYASPNARVNKRDFTKINQLIDELLGNNGKYIGVTATPARLNLNNTFKNKSDKWVTFKPHKNYVGQDFFFPNKINITTFPYKLYTFPSDSGDDKIQMEEAILHFLCGAAELRLRGSQENYSMLIHTSGKMDEHTVDFNIVKSVLMGLSTPSKPSRFNSLKKKLFNIAEKDFSQYSSNVGLFVLQHIRKSSIVEINSKNTKINKVEEIANPSCFFAFGVGGNIISRGVTFNNLLSMYFTRSVKGKLSQDTYIQRARMFGTRPYKKDFQLWIPEALMDNWINCFTFHRFGLDALNQGLAPVWLSDPNTIPTATSSIDRSSVNIDDGEMSFNLFGYDEKKIQDLFTRKNQSDKKILDGIKNLLDDDCFPKYIYEYIVNDPGRVSFHKPSEFGTTGSQYTLEEKSEIRRKKGIFGTNEYSRSEKPDAVHHLKVFYNNEGKARLFYKLRNKVRFIKNTGR